MIVDCVGNASFERVWHLLRPGGSLLLVIADLPGVLRAPSLSKRTGNLISASVGKPTAEDLALLVDLAEAGHYRAVRDRTYELADISKAHRFVDTGRKRGNVVVRIAADESDRVPSPTETSTEASS